MRVRPTPVALASGRCRGGDAVARAWTEARRAARPSGDRTAEDPEDGLHVLPDVLLRRRVAQQEGRMERRHDSAAIVLADTPAQPADRLGRLEQPLRAELPQAHEHAGSDGADLR